LEEVKRFLTAKKRLEIMGQKLKGPAISSLLDKLYPLEED
jgi:hypothetical protein